MQSKEYTARPENWVHHKNLNVITGEIYDDKKGRWRNGTKIMTSNLLGMSMQSSSPKEGVAIATLNNIYLLGRKK